MFGGAGRRLTCRRNTWYKGICRCSALFTLGSARAAVSPGESLLFVSIALVLLGLGWNLGLISGTALIVDPTLPTTRAKTQGSVDVFIALAGSTGGAMSGMVAANSSYETLSLIGGGLSLILIPVIIQFMNSKVELNNNL